MPLIKNIIKKIYGYLMKIVRVIGVVNSFIILTIFYFSIFAVVALPKKIFFRKESDKATYWHDFKQSEIGDFLDQF